MVGISEEGYIKKGRAELYSVFLVKSHTAWKDGKQHECGYITIGQGRLYVPKEYIGKRVRLKVRIERHFHPSPI